MSDTARPSPDAAPETAAETIADITELTVAQPEEAAAARPPPEPPPAPLLAPMSPIERLKREPARFDIDQATAVTLRASGLPADEPEALVLRSAARLAMPAGAVIAAKPEEGELTLGTFGLIGAGGALPRHHTAQVAAEQRKRSLALHAFLDMLGGRTTGLYSKAGAKYRPTRNPEPTARVLSAAIGMGTPDLEERTRIPQAALLFHAGNLAARTRSAERLRAMLEAETGLRVEVQEFAGGFIRLPEEERTRMPKGRGAPQHCALGVSTTAGAQVWDPQARVIIRFGPLDRADFDSLLPGTPAWLRVTQLARLFVGPDTAFAVNLVLRAPDVPSGALGSTSRLGWTSWMGASKPRKGDARDAVFEPREVV
ncbi:type VI secretion system baseplate subunit TssG [Roseomonas terrae]|jgi:type VI secretion system protein ImpH|uniref:Type VI secretion system baseplate subunit TssG n=1 Tax=Neoroseomonas terrae TaxID=424799 RepID=A0ABS5EH05_9PROT|nr:type VI secretion system baseplate subunit TssG [Neoroseomonas terrae]MBR0650302.1 type VI secretion system baseplate subunit TssG [Neoroseomonas terrae]